MPGNDSLDGLISYYLMLITPNSVSDSPFEGGLAPLAIDYFKSLAQLVDKTKTPLELNPAVKVKALEFFKEVQALQKLISDYPKRGITPVISWLRERLESTTALYLPLGWNGVPGHFLMAKIKCDGKTTKISLINLGAGAGYHRVVAKGEHHNYMEYQSREFPLDLSKEFPIYVLEKFIAIYNDGETFDLDKYLNPYDEEDYYAPLMLLEDDQQAFREERAPPNIEKGFIPQQTGTCTMTAQEMALYDYLLIENGFAQVEVKKYLFSLKLAAFRQRVDGYRRQPLQGGVIDYTKHFLLFELNELISQGTLKQDEAEVVLEELEGFSYPAKTKGLTGKEIPLPSENFELGKLEEALEEYERKPSMAKAYKSINFSFDLDNIIESLTKAIKYLKEEDHRNERINEIRNALNVLSDVGSNEEYWQSFNEQQSLETIVLLAHLSQAYSRVIIELELLDGVSNYLFTLQLFEIAQLVAANTKYFSFGEIYSLGISDRISSYAISDGQDYYQLKRVTYNFQHYSQQKTIVFGNEMGKTAKYLNQILPAKQKEDFKNSLSARKCRVDDGFEMMFANALQGHCESMDRLQYLNLRESLGPYVVSLLTLSRNLNIILDWEFRYVYNRGVVAHYDKSSRLFDGYKEQQALRHSRWYQSTHFFHKGKRGPYNDRSENMVYLPESYRALRDAYFSPFEHYGVGYLEKKRDFTGNEVKLSSAWQAQDLEVISVNQKMKFNRALIYATNNVESLVDDEFQKAIKELLFDFGALDMDLKQTPFETFAVVNKFLERSYDRYKLHPENSKKDNLAFFGVYEIQHGIRSYIEEASLSYLLPIERLRWPDYFPLLAKENASLYKKPLQVLIHKAMLLCYKEEVPLVHFGAYMRAFLAYHLELDDSKTLANPTHCRKVIESSLTNYQRVKDLLVNDAICEVFHIETNSAWHVQGDFLVAEEQELAINLRLGVFSKGGNEVKKYKISKVDLETFSDGGLQLEPLTFSVIAREPIVLESVDGKLQLEMRKGDATQVSQIRRVVNIEGKKPPIFVRAEALRWGQTTSISYAKHLLEKKEYFCWYYKGALERPLLFESLKGTNDLLYYRPNIYQLGRVKDGHFVGENHYLVENSEHNQTPDFKAWQKYLAEAVGQIQYTLEIKEDTLLRIHLYELGLSFVPVGPRLCSEQYSHYHLETQFQLEFSKAQHPYVVLINDEGDRKVIVPQLNLGHGNTPYFLEGQQLKKMGVVTQQSLEKTFVFELINDTLESTRPEANLYLSLLSMRFGDLRLAVSYLGKSHHNSILSDNELHLFIVCLKVSDNSELSLGFQMKFIARFKEQEETFLTTPSMKLSWMIEDFEPQEKEKLNKKILLYYRLIDKRNDGSSQLPEYLRLTAYENHLLMELYKYLNRATALPDHRLYTKDLLLERIEELEHPVKFSEEISDYEIRHTICWQDSDFYDGEIVESGRAKVLKRQALNVNEDKRAYALTKSYLLSMDPSLFGSYLARFESYKQVEKFPSLPYVDTYFFELAKELLSSDLQVVRTARLDVFSLIRNNYYTTDCKNLHEHLRALAILAKNPQPYMSLKGISSKFDFFRLFDVITRDRKSLSDGLNFIPRGVALGNEAIAKKIEPPRIIPIEPISFTALKINHYPILDLSTLVHKHFKLSERYKLSDNLSLHSDDPIEKKILSELRVGQEINRLKPIKKYQLLVESEQKLISGMTVIFRENQNAIQRLEKEITELISRLPNTLDGIRYQALHSASLVEAPTIDLLIQCYLGKDLETILASNPMLTRVKLEQALEKVVRYMQLKVQQEQLKEAFAILDRVESAKEAQQELAEILMQKNPYDLAKYPEFLVYEYHSGQRLRLEQVNNLIKVINAIEQGNKSFDYQHVLLQFKAGGGKTSVIIPILSKRFSSQGLSPVIVNTNELYQIAKSEVPRSLAEHFDIRVVLIERDIDYRWSNHELERLHTSLEFWRGEGRVLLIKASAWYGINNADKMALQQGQYDLASRAYDVLMFFREKTIKLEDEAHLISSPLQESVKAYGPTEKFSTAEREFMLSLYYFLLDSEEVLAIVNLSDEDNVQLHSSEVRALQRCIMEFVIGKGEFLELNPQDLKNYLQASNSRRPPWLKQLATHNKETANLVVMARSFINTHFPHTLSLQVHKDYGYSIHQGDNTIAPKHDGQDVTAQFGDPLLRLALATQYYLTQGLSPNRFIEVVNTLIKQHEKEKTFFGEVTPASKTLDKIFDNATMASLNPATIANRAELAYYRKKRAAVELYLKQHTYPQISKPINVVVSTPAELQGGFKRSILFTATPGLRELYPAFIRPENTFLTPEFEAEVLTTLLSDNNREHCLIDYGQTPLELFSNLKGSCSELFNKMTAFIDRGGLLINHQGEAVVRAMVNVAGDLAAKHSALFFDKNQLNVFLKDLKEEVIPVLGTRYQEAVINSGLNPQNLLFFMYLSLARTTGTDIKRPMTDVAALTVGKEQTLTETIQAAMRERGLLTDNGQRIIWVLFKELYQKINPEGQEAFDPLVLMTWLIKNEAIEAKQKIIVRAFQGIDQAITDALYHSFHQQQRLYSDHQEQLAPRQSISIYHNYELESTVVDTRLALEAYTNQRLESFNLPFDHLANESQKRIKDLIIQTAALVKEIAKSTNSLTQESFQEQEKNEEQDQELQVTLQREYDKSTDFELGDDSYDSEDRLPLVFSNLADSEIYKPIELATLSQEKYPKVYLDVVRFSPFKVDRADTRVTSRWQKPIRNLLLQVKQNSKVQIVALSEVGSKFYFNQILNHPESSSIKYLLVTFDGSVLACSPNVRDPQHHMSEVMQKARWAATFVTLLNGELANPVMLASFIFHYQLKEEDFDAFIDYVDGHKVSAHLNQLHNLKETLSQYYALAKRDALAPPVFTTTTITSKQKRINRATVYATFFSAIPVLEGYKPVNKTHYESVEDHRYSQRKSSSSSIGLYCYRTDGVGLPQHYCPGQADFELYVTEHYSDSHALVPYGAPYVETPFSGDNFELTTCRPVNLYGKDGVYCDGDNSSLYYVPKLSASIDDQLSHGVSTFALGAVLYNIAKSAVGWFFSSPQEKVMLVQEQAHAELQKAKLDLERLATLIPERSELFLRLETLTVECQDLEKRLLREGELGQEELSEFQLDVNYLRQCTIRLSEQQQKDAYQVLVEGFIGGQNLTEEDLAKLMEAFFISDDLTPQQANDLLDEMAKRCEYSHQTILALFEHYVLLRQFFQDSSAPMYENELMDFQDAQERLLNKLHSEPIRPDDHFVEALIKSQHYTPQAYREQPQVFYFWGNGQPSKSSNHPAVPQPPKKH